MRSRISRRLILFFVLLSLTVLGVTLPVEGKGGFCAGVCGERFGTWDSVDGVTFE